jgi:hypothetical protein
MNIFRTIKILRRFGKVFGLLEKGSKDWDARQRKGEDMSKSLFKSKTFWFNIFTAAAELTQVLPLPAGYLTIAAAVINVGLRMTTETPVHVVDPRP